ncbi:MAG: hypothetical protein N2485_08465, partial [bacterium]|nr:hypothetical protein [bacterium]
REENLQEKEKHIKEVEKKIKQEYDEKVKEGYDNGFRQGYNDGLEKAKNEIELKINKVLLEIEKEKNKIIDNVYNENINKIRELMKVVLEKLFLQYINDEQILLNYF